ncbi:MAG: FG-GAP-like repeat-containing protein [Bifidobacteriaceae bacterium]|jgi:hypothetical protein|nr:FG-GAP-like repeat-containing protein [Bifidobacteriaceae bacterium]
MKTARLIVSVGLVVGLVGVAPVLMTDAQAGAAPVEEFGVTSLEAKGGEVNLDPRIADMLVQVASELLGDRFVDVWVAEDQSGFEVGAVNLTKADQVVLDELKVAGPVALVSAPVPRGVLDAAAESVVEALGESLVMVGPDYKNGVIRAEVLKADLAKATKAIGTVTGVSTAKAADNRKAWSKGDVVPVELKEGRPDVLLGSLSPLETQNELPLRAGKRIYIGGRGYCTANILVRIGSARHVLTAGHCGAVGDQVSVGPVSLETIGASTFYSSGNNSTITADVGRFPAPARVEPSVFKQDNLTSNVTGWANPIVGQQACFRGAATGSERCGTISAVNTSFTGSLEGAGSRTVTGLFTIPLQGAHGDSGAPVYYKGASGVVILGILSSGSQPTESPLIRVSSMRTALPAAGNASVVMAPGLGVPVVSSSSIASGFPQLVLSPDMSLDGQAELVGVDPSGRLLVYSPNDLVTAIGSAGLMGIGFGSHTVTAPGDWSGDGVPDIISSTSDGYLWLFSGLGGGAINSKVQIGHGWSSYKVVPVGDVTSDGYNDLLAVHKTTGDLRLYPGNGAGGFLASSQVGNGWNGYTLYAAGDLNGDGKADILSINTAGDMFYYRGVGNGTFQTRVRVGNGWTGFKLASGGDLNGDGMADIVGRQNSTSKLYYYRSTGSGAFATKVQIGSGF